MSLELQLDVLINKLRLIPNVYNLASVSVYLPVSGIAHCVLFTFTVEGHISGCTFVSRIWARARTHKHHSYCLVSLYQSSVLNTHLFYMLL